MENERYLYMTLLLLLGWTSPSAAWLWTLAVIGIILIPPVTASVVDLMRKPDDAPAGQHLAAAMRTSGWRFAQAAFALAPLDLVEEEATFSLNDQQYREGEVICEQQ